MSLKTEFKEALEGGAAHDALLDLVRRHKQAGLDQRPAYDALRALWLEYGFDDDAQDDENAVRDNLEYVMEVVWGYCPAGSSLWPTSLSRERQPT